MSENDIKGDVLVTSSAQEKISTLLQEMDGQAEAVRIYVSGGGCSGMSYGMTFSAEDRSDMDVVFDYGEGCRIVVDALALNFLNGSEIDYSNEGLNSSFVFNNVFQSVGGSGSCGGCGGAS